MFLGYHILSKSMAWGVLLTLKANINGRCRRWNVPHNGLHSLVLPNTYSDIDDILRLFPLFTLFSSTIFPRANHRFCWVLGWWKVCAVYKEIAQLLIDLRWIMLQKHQELFARLLKQVVRNFCHVCAWTCISRLCAWLIYIFLIQWLGFQSPPSARFNTQAL